MDLQSLLIVNSIVTPFLDTRIRDSIENVFETNNLTLMGFIYIM